MFQVLNSHTIKSYYLKGMEGVLMWIWLGSSLFLLFLIIVLLLLSHIKLRLLVKKNNKDDMILLDVTLFYGMISQHYNIPMIEMKNLQDGLVIVEEVSNSLHKGQAEQEQAINKNKIKQWMDNFKAMLMATLGLKKWINSTLRHVKVSQLDWSTNIALSDAAHTATLTGLIWALKSTLVGVLSYHISLRKHPNLFVVPKFGCPPLFVSELQSKAQIRCGYALYALLILIFRVMRQKKGLRKWLRILSKARARAKTKENKETSRT
jgi:flagellar biosynthesis/type III secretory pathway chaperone